METSNDHRIIFIIYFDFFLVDKFLRINSLVNNRLKEFLENSGLQEIEQREIMLPLNSSDGKIGMYGRYLNF